MSRNPTPSPSPDGSLRHLARGLLLWLVMGASAALAGERVAVLATRTDEDTRAWIQDHPGSARAGMDPDRVAEDAAQLMARALQDAGFELVPATRSYLYHTLPGTETTRGIEDFGDSLGVTTTFLVGIAPGTSEGSGDDGFHIQVSKLLLRRSRSAKPVAGCAVPTDASVDQFLAVKACLGQLTDVPVKGTLTVEVADSRHGQAIASPTIEVMGQATLHAGGSVELEAGTYTIQVNARGYEPASRTVTLAEGQDSSVSLTLDALGAVVVQGPRGATVAIDGRSGLAHEPISVSPNEALSLLVRKGKRTFSTTVRLTPGETLEVKARLRR